MKSGDKNGKIKTIADINTRNGYKIEKIGTTIKLIIKNNKLTCDEKSAKNGKIVTCAEKDIAKYCAIILGQNLTKKLQKKGYSNIIPHTQAIDIKNPTSKAESGLIRSIVNPATPIALSESYRLPNNMAIIIIMPIKPARKTEGVMPQSTQ